MTGAESKFDIKISPEDNVLKMKGGRIYPKILGLLSSQDDVILCNGTELTKKLNKWKINLKI